jgi:hypothetical protein
MSQFRLKSNDFSTSDLVKGLSPDSFSLSKRCIQRDSRVTISTRPSHFPAKGGSPRGHQPHATRTLDMLVQNLAGSDSEGRCRQRRPSRLLRVEPGRKTASGAACNPQRSAGYKTCNSFRDNVRISSPRVRVRAKNQSRSGSASWLRPKPGNPDVFSSLARVIRTGLSWSRDAISIRLAGLLPDCRGYLSDNHVPNCTTATGWLPSAPVN